MTARRAVPQSRSGTCRSLIIGGALSLVLLVAVFFGFPAVGKATSPAGHPPTASSPVGDPPATMAESPEAVSASPPATGSQQGAPAELVLMSFNILTSDPVIYGRNPGIPRSELAFAARAPGIAAQITAADPDIVALQENFGDPLPYDLLRGRLRGYEWVKPMEQVSILVRKSRFIALTVGYRDLHRTEKGFLSWVKLQDRLTGRSLWVFDVHLRSGTSRSNAAIRSAESDTLRARMLQLNPGLADPVVLMGDLNVAATERRALYRDPVAKLGAGGLVDAATVAPLDISNVPRADSFHGFKAQVGGRTLTKVVSQTGRRIDFIFVPGDSEVLAFGVLTGPKVERAVVDGHRVYRWPGVVSSDHSPVVARINLTNR